ncbi:MAG: phosphoenolpyruvate--protein phosphotransferase [Tissierellia bacterium]|nr:phosphoenolpyruvate--protein phosphotransferase [Tissierellia bacterium]
MKLKGIVASDGIAIGPVYKFEKVELEIPQDKIEDDKVEEQLELFNNSVKSYINFLQEKINEKGSQSEIFEAHIGMLEDPFLIESTENRIKDEKMNAAMALDATANEFIAMMSSLDDEYLKERADDYKDIRVQILNRILGLKSADLSLMKKEGIIVAKDLTPSDTSTMNADLVNGIVTDFGGKTAHTSIIAQTLGIPALVGMQDAFDKLENGQTVIIDTENGVLIVEPDDELLAKYKEKYEKLEKEQKILEENMFKKAITEDGKEIDVFCNIGNIGDLDLGLSQGAEGVGLFRTEFLYMDNDKFPTEEEQFEVYKDAAEKLEGKALTIRTLDIGGDKELSYFEFPKEDNPFLGWRALRICFDMPEVFKTQLRAILRASAYGKVLILLPMVISVSEVEKSVEIIEECKAELKKEGLEFDENIEVGIMIETPASVLIADELIEKVDYFSIGTNDLTQYLLAVDRGNQKIADLYNSYHPAVLRSIKRVIDASHKVGKWTGMCGGFASDTKATKLLLGLGLDEFSVVSGNIAKIKDNIRNTSMEEAEKFADKILNIDSAEKIENSL